MSRNQVFFPRRSTTSARFFADMKKKTPTVSEFGGNAIRLRGANWFTHAMVNKHGGEKEKLRGRRTIVMRKEIFVGEFD